MVKSKMLLAMALMLAFSSVARAQWNLPTGGDGTTLPPSEAPCIPFHIDNATGTAEVLIVGTAGATGNTVSKSYGYVAWVQLSSGTASGAYLALNDTDKTGSGDKYNAVPPLTFTEPVASGNVDTTKSSSKFLAYRPPFVFQNGLTAKLSATGLAATICYRKIAGPQVP